MSSAPLLRRRLQVLFPHRAGDALKESTLGMGLLNCRGAVTRRAQPLLCILSPLFASLSPSFFFAALRLAAGRIGAMGPACPGRVRPRLVVRRAGRACRLASWTPLYSCLFSLPLVFATEV